MKGWKNRKEYKSHSALPEADRRYYSAKQSLLYGAENVFTKPKRVYDDKFFDDFSIPPNHWYLYDNQPLKEKIEESVYFPLATSYYKTEKNKKEEQGKEQPRLLIVVVDVEEAETVVFDSHNKPNGTRNTRYGYDEKSQEFKQNIEYNDGLMIEHVMASASVPLYYDLTHVPLRYDYTKTKKERENDIKAALQQEQIEEIQRYRRFWRNIKQYASKRNDTGTSGLLDKYKKRNNNNNKIRNRTNSELGSLHH